MNSFDFDNLDLSGYTDPRTSDTTMLAYIGDAVYELYVRSFAATEAKPGVHAGELNKYTVAFVKADSQAESAKAIMAADVLTEEELSLMKRARNRTSTSAPRGSTPKAYKLATGLEALIGWLYITGERERLNEICSMAMEHAASGDRKKPRDS